MPDRSPIGNGGAAAPSTEPIPAMDTLTAAFQHSMIGMAVWSPDSRLFDANRALCRMFGYEHDEFLAHGFTRISHPGDPELDPAQWPRLVAGETDTYQREKRYRHKDGSILWGLVTVSALRDEKGEFTGCLVQVQDITARKSAEAAARHQEAQIEALVGQLPVALYTLPPGARAAFQYVSPQFERLTGLGRDELPTSFDDLLSRLHPDDREAVREADRHSTRTGEPAQVEYRICGGNGEWIWVDHRSILLRDEQGRPLAWHGALLDISERKRLESSLRESQERFRRAFEDAAIGMSLGTPDDICLDANAAYCRIVNRPREALIGHTFAEINHPDDVAVYVRQHARLYADEVDSYEIEKRYPRPDGTVVTGLLTVSAVHDHSGVHLYDIGQLQDITAQKAAEAALRESETHLRTIVEQMPVAVYRLEPGAGGRYTYTSPRFTELTGLTLHGHDGDLEAYLARVHPDDVETVRLGDAEAAETGQPLDLEYRLRAHDGSWNWVHDRSTLTRDERGRPLAWHGGLLDISEKKSLETALRESEMRFRSIFEGTGIGMALSEPDGRIVVANPALERLLGYVSGKLEGVRIEEITYPEDLALQANHLRRMRQSELDAYQFEKRFVRKDGGIVWGLLNATAVKDERGVIQAVIGQVQDITARKEAERASEAALQAQQAAIAELERLNQSKSRFLSTISHEFRTPLTAIIGYSELLASNVSNPAIAEDAAIIHREASRLNRLVDDILFVDRVDAGHMSLKMISVDINALIRDVVATFRPLTDSHRFPLDLDPSLRPIDGDRDRLAQAITNLVSNAVKYFPAGGTVAITTRNDGDDVVISVRDEGIGVAKEDLSRNFDRFERVETGIAGRIAGTGLGLSIVQEIASLHGGRLWADSELGLGSTFHLAIPASASR